MSISKRRMSVSSLRSKAFHRAQWGIRDIPFCSESFEYLIDTCPKFLRDARVPIMKRQFLLGEVGDQISLVAGKHAMEATGATQRTIERLKNSADCCASSANSSIHLYDKHNVAQALKDFKSATGELKCAKLLGVPSYTLNDFIQAGHLRPIGNPDAALLSDRLLIDTDSLNELIEKLSRPPATTIAEHGISLQEAMFGVLAPAVWSAVFSALLNGCIRVCEFRAGDALCQRLVVVESDIEEVKRAGATNVLPDIEIPCSQVAETLGLSDVRISGAVRLGLLHGRQQGKSFLVKLRDVGDFHKSYVLATEITRTYGISPQAFAKKIRKLGCKPVGKGYTSNYWLRSDLGRLFPSVAGN